MGAPSVLLKLNFLSTKGASMSLDACGRKLSPFSYRLFRAKWSEQTCDRPKGHAGSHWSDPTEGCRVLQTPPLWRQAIYFARWWRHLRLINRGSGEWSSRRYAFARAWPYRYWPRERGMVGWIKENDGSRRYYTQRKEIIPRSISDAG